MTYLSHLTSLAKRLTTKESKTTLSFATLDKDSETPTFRSLNISRCLAAELREAVHQKVTEVVAAVNGADLMLVQHKEGYHTEPHEIAVEHIDSSHLAEFLKPLPAPASIPLLGTDEPDFLSGIRFYMMQFSGSPVYATTLRRISPTKELARSSNFLVGLVGDRYERLVSNTFSIDAQIDALVTGEHVYLFSQENSDHMFRVLEQLVKQAKPILAAIKARVPIDNFSAMESSCLRHPLKLRKLRNIAARPYFGQLNFADLKRVITTFSLRILIRNVNGTEHLHFDESHHWDILNLLDDMYLSSDLTQLKYAANSKQSI